MLKLTGPPEDAAAQLIAHLQATGVLDARGDLRQGSDREVGPTTELLEPKRLEPEGGALSEAQASQSPKRLEPKAGRMAPPQTPPHAGTPAS